MDNTTNNMDNMDNMDNNTNDVNDLSMKDSINEYYTNKIVVVTGGTGFIGRNLVTKLLRLPLARVIIFDRTIKYERWTREYLSGKLEIIQGDLLDTGDMNILTSLDFDILFHQAAIVDTTCSDKDLITKTNVDAFIKLVEICNTKGAKMVYASSAAVYGNTPPPNKEWEGENPLNLYGESKLEMDKYILRHKKMFSVPIIGLRYFNVYGWGESHKKNMKSMITKMAEKIERGENVELFEYGEQMRDFIYVGDVVNCNLLAGMYEYTDVFNCGTGVAVSFNDVYHIICDYIGVSPKSEKTRIKYIKNNYPFFQNHTLANISRTSRQLGYIPKYNIHNGIWETLNNMI